MDRNTLISFVEKDLFLFRTLELMITRLDNTNFNFNGDNMSKPSSFFDIDTSVRNMFDNYFNFNEYTPIFESTHDKTSIFGIIEHNLKITYDNIEDYDDKFSLMVTKFNKYLKLYTQKFEIFYNRKNFTNYSFTSDFYIGNQHILLSMSYKNKDNILSQSDVSTEIDE